MRRPVLLTLYVAVAAFAGLSGWWLGAAAGGRRARAARAAELAAWQSELDRSIRDIAIGSPFPHFTVWSVDGRQSFDAANILPHGGVIALVSPTCEGCVEFVQALQDAVKEAGVHARAVVLLLDSGMSAPLVDALSQRGIQIPMFCDVEQSMRRVHRVTADPIYFCVNSVGVVTDLGVNRHSRDELVEIVTE